MAPLTAQLDAYVADLVAKGVPRDKAESTIRAAFGVADDAAPVVDEAALEKAIAADGDKLMRAHGFTVIAFSQPRASMQTPGIPDRRFYRPFKSHPGHGLVCWWEAKSATGEQSPAQREFQSLCEACGECYVLGTHAALYSWLAEHGVVHDGVLHTDARAEGGVKRLAGPIEGGGGRCPPRDLPPPPPPLFFSTGPIGGGEGTRAAGGDERTLNAGGGE